MTLRVHPRMEVVGDRDEVEAVFLGHLGDVDEATWRVFLARQREPELCCGHGPQYPRVDIDQTRCDDVIRWSPFRDDLMT